MENALKKIEFPNQPGFSLEDASVFLRLAALNYNPKDIQEKFFDRVDRSAGPDGCWIFRGSTTTAGYGQIGLSRPIRHIRTHRLAYMLEYGPIPDGFLVMHSCDNPPCCNPNHLGLGRHKDNSRDALSKERLPGGIAPAVVEEIEALLDTTDLTCQEIAARLGVRRHVVHRVRAGKHPLQSFNGQIRFNNREKAKRIADIIQAETGRKYRIVYLAHLLGGSLKSKKLSPAVKNALEIFEDELRRPATKDDMFEFISSNGFELSECGLGFSLVKNGHRFILPTLSDAFEFARDHSKPLLLEPRA